MSEKIKIYLERNEYFFLMHTLKALLLLHKSLKAIENGANFEILESITKARFKLENARYRNYNIALCENILKALEKYEISELNE